MTINPQSWNSHPISSQIEATVAAELAFLTAPRNAIDAQAAALALDEINNRFHTRKEWYYTPGGMSWLFLAWDWEFSTFAVIKVYKQNRLNHEEVALGKSESPHTTHILAKGKIRGLENRHYPYVVLNYIRGYDLSHWVQQNQSWAERPRRNKHTLRCLIDVAESVLHLHQNDYTHNDLHGGNIRIAVKFHQDRLPSHGVLLDGSIAQPLRDDPGQNRNAIQKDVVGIGRCFAAIVSGDHAWTKRTTLPDTPLEIQSGWWLTRDLRYIIQRALTGGYASIADLHTGLLHYQQRRCPPGMTNRAPLQHWVSQHPARTLFVAAGVTFLILTVCFLLLDNKIAKQEIQIEAQASKLDDQGNVIEHLTDSRFEELSQRISLSHDQAGLTLDKQIRSQWISNHLSPAFSQLFNPEWRKDQKELDTLKKSSSYWAQSPTLNAFSSLIDIAESYASKSHAESDAQLDALKTKHQQWDERCQKTLLDRILLLRGDVALFHKDKRKAQDTYQELAIFRSNDWQSWLWTSQVAVSRQDWVIAEQSAGKAEALYQAIFQKLPTVAYPQQFTLYSLLLNNVVIYTSQKKIKESVAYMRKCLEQSELLPQDSPIAPHLSFWGAIMRFELAKMLTEHYAQDLKSLMEAQGQFQRGLSQLKLIPKEQMAAFPSAAIELKEAEKGLLKCEERIKQHGK